MRTKEESQAVLNEIKEFVVEQLSENRVSENSFDQQISIIQELIDSLGSVVRPTTVGWYRGIVFTDGRKSADIYVGKCDCGMVVYSNWKRCPYCENRLDWEEENAKQTEAKPE